MDWLQMPKMVTSLPLYQRSGGGSLDVIRWIVWSIATILVIVCGVSVYLKRRRIARLIGYLPGSPVTFPIVGNLEHITKITMKWSMETAHIILFQMMCGFTHVFDKERIFHFWISVRPVVMLYKPETVEAVLSSSHILEKSFEYRLLHPWLGTGLLTSSGPKWKPRRKLLTPAFHFRILEDFLPILNEQSRLFAKNLKQQVGKDYVDMVSLVTLCTLDIICETAMGVHIGAQENSQSEYVKSLYEVGETFLARVLRPWLWPEVLFKLSSQGRRFHHSLNVLHDFTRKVICDRKSEILKTKKDDESLYVSDDHFGGKRRRVFLDLLLNVHLKDGSLSLEEIREEVDTFMFEGHDTTAMAISWALYLIGLDVKVQRKIQDELDDIFGDDDQRPITLQDLRKMKYLECSIKEAQRLFPSVPFVGRELETDVEINGYTLPRGTTCCLFFFMLHRNPDVFANPEHFDPDRFLPENSVGRHPFAYVPFSAGPRNCIGQKFAMMEEKTVLANVFRRFNLTSLDQRDKIQMIAEMVIRPKNGLRVMVKER